MRTLDGWGRAWQTHFALPMARLFGGFRRHAFLWRRRLSLRLFLQGLPALLGIAGVATLTVLALSVSNGEVGARYAERGRAAFQAKDYPLAVSCLERAYAQGGEQPEILFELARAAEALGQTERAALLMSRLAPEEGQGYGEAHLWQAVYLLRMEPQSSDRRKAAEKHLLLALQGEIQNRDLAHVLLGEVYLADGHLDLAEPHLTRALKAFPTARMRLARLYQLRGDNERARREALVAAEHYKARAQANLHDHFARLAWADAVAFGEQFPDAVTILEEGWTVSQKGEYRVALGRVYAAWCDYQVRVKGGKDVDQLGLVEKGLAHDPANAALLNRLLAALGAGGADADKARQALQGMLARGEAAGVAHFALGVDAWHNGKVEEARLHWERAIALAPQMTLAANNLAMLLSEGRRPDLARAAQLINLVLDKAPNHPGYRDTRGRIYARMGKWREALDDLEAALPRAANDPSLHRVLATVYEQLGNGGMAAEHRRQADQLAAQKAKG
jgi:tetratricopeptide (TPR) repeat protein